ncbi:MAG: six-hairpin glycosidase, partial [Clostridia bacterium]|nr:six-hairpin glycosidase [Clostridia bacterium]
DNIVKTGTSFPAHEVNYEQTIVSPAATFISEFGQMTGESLYTEAASLHIELLDRFDGTQPSHRLNEIPIRYWDGFWFGKALQFGDTMPHYWSCLSARSFADFALCSKNDEYANKARVCMRNCMSNYLGSGKGSCAYIYPYKVNGKRGQFYDVWSNDQNTALYFALQIRDAIGTL